MRIYAKLGPSANKVGVNKCTNNGSSKPPTFNYSRTALCSLVASNWKLDSSEGFSGSAAFYVGRGVSYVGTTMSHDVYEGGAEGLCY